MNPFRTHFLPSRSQDARPRRIAALATVGAALAMVVGASVPASATPEVATSTTPSSVAAAPVDLASSDLPNAGGYFVFGNVVGSPDNYQVLVEVLESPRYGETGTFTVRYTWLGGHTIVNTRSYRMLGPSGKMVSVAPPTNGNSGDLRFYHTDAWGTTTPAIGATRIASVTIVGEEGLGCAVNSLALGSPGYCEDGIRAPMYLPPGHPNNPIGDPSSPWDDGNNVGVATYFDSNHAWMATTTGVFDVVEYPAPGEAGTVTVRASFINVAGWGNSDAMFHAPYRDNFIVGTQATETRHAGGYLNPTQHLYTRLDPITELTTWRQDREYGWIKMEVGEDWDREVTVTGVGNWHAPDTGMVAPPLEDGPNGITVELTDWKETVSGQTIDYTVKVTVDPAVVVVPDHTRFKVTVSPGAVPSSLTIPEEGGLVTFDGTLTGSNAEKEFVNVWVNAEAQNGGNLYALHQERLGPSGTAWGDDDVRVRAIEVNQAIQDWKNSIPLIELKKTGVRVFLEIKDELAAQPVAGLLYGNRASDGAPLPYSPLSADNLNHETTPVTDAQSERDHFDSSLNYKIPNSWTMEGPITLRIDGNGTELLCGEGIGNTEPDCSVNVDFESVPLPEIRYYYVTLDSPIDDLSEENRQILFEQNQRIDSLYPIAYTKHDYGVLSVDRPSADSQRDVLDAVNEALVTLRGEGDCLDECRTIYIGVIQGDSNGGYIGLADAVPSDVDSFFTMGVDSYPDTGYGRNTGSHELGHVLGLNHAADHSLIIRFDSVVDEWVETTSVEDKGSRMVSCGNAQSPVWDPNNLDVQVPEHEEMGEGTYASGWLARPLMGPLEVPVDPDSEVWGLDVLHLRDRDLEWMYPESAFPEAAIVSPYETYALMGYCWLGSPQDLWVSEQDWGPLIQGISTRFGGNAPTLAATQASSVAVRNLMVPVRIDLSVPSDATAGFGTVWTHDSTKPPQDTGKYRLLVWKGDSLVVEVPFDASLPVASVTLGVDMPSTASALVLAPIGDQDYTRLEVVKDGVVLGGLDASSHAPELSKVDAVITTVEGTKKLRITWDARDRDNDPLLAMIRFSPDSGETWEAIRISVPDSQVSIPVSQIGGAEGGIVEVQVTDGVLVSDAVVSEPVDVPDSPPEIEYLDGLGDTRLASGGTSVWAEVEVYDKEDGRIDGDVIVWQSNLDGVIGVGSELIFDTTDLTEGLHLITLTVTDSSGNVVAVTDYLNVQHNPVYVEPPAVTPQDPLSWLRSLLMTMDLHPGVRNPLDNTLADVQKEVNRNRLAMACKALDRFQMLVDNREGDTNGLTGEDAAILRSVADLLGDELGCEAE